MLGRRDMCCGEEKRGGHVRRIRFMLCIYASWCNRSRLKVTEICVYFQVK